MFGHKYKTNMSNYHPVEIVGRDRETQLQVGENFNSITYRVKSFNVGYVLYNLYHYSKY